MGKTLGEIVYGEEGWYWATATGFSATLTNHRTINKHFPLPDHRFQKGEEWTVHLTHAQWRFHRMERLLKIGPEQETLKLKHDSSGSIGTPKIASAILQYHLGILGKNELAAVMGLTPAELTVWLKKANQIRED